MPISLGGLCPIKPIVPTEEASLGFSMALQIRNKLMDAYTEVMRMSV